MTSSVDHRPDLRLGAAILLVLGATTGSLVVWALSMRDRLPEPVARHWGASGVADGYSSLSVTVATAAGLVLIATVPMALPAVFARQPVLMRRFLAGVSVWLAVFVTAVVADSLRGQLDLTDPSLAPMPGVGIGVGIGAGVVAGLAVAALARPDGTSTRAASAPPASARRVVGDNGSLVWHGEPAGLDRAAVVVAGIAGVGLSLLALAISWWLLPMAALIVTLILAGARVRTTADEEGFTVSVFGRRMVHVPLADIALADVTDVNPFWEFGGWGLRIDIAGRTGVVTRRGPAVRIRRGDGSEVLVTVDGAERAAAVVNSLADEFHRTS